MKVETNILQSVMVNQPGNNASLAKLLRENPEVEQRLRNAIDRLTSNLYSPDQKQEQNVSRRNRI